MAISDDSSVTEAVDAARAKQGKVTGVIIPPPEIRAVVDKTAQFVARNGKSFEKRILDSGEGKTSKFNFMKVYDPYHAYYEKKISEFEGGTAVKETTATPPVEPVHVPKKEEAPVISASKAGDVTAAKASVTNPLARFAMMKVTDPPPALEFSAGHPSGMSSSDMDIMKLAAQYTALNGRDFLSGLAQREQRNPQFDFLKPTHMLFSYFTSLVDAYAKLLQPPAMLLKTVKEKSTLLGALEKSVGRWVWERAEEERKKREVREADAERSAFQSIDWYDFSVVETIEFEEDELYEPAGMLDGGRTLPSVPEVSHDMDEDMDMDMDEDMDIEEGDSSASVRQSVSTAVARDDDDDDMKVVTDYTPRTASQKRGKEKESTMMIDPVSGKAIAVDQMSEHMRVQLMDPRWRIEQQRFLDKQQDTGFAEGSSIADSLKQFARQRGDICGSAEEEEARLLADEGKRKKRVEETNRIIWDGHQSSIETVKRQKLEQEHYENSADSVQKLSEARLVGPSLSSMLPATTTNVAQPPISLHPPIPPPTPTTGGYFQAPSLNNPHLPPPLPPPIPPMAPMNVGSLGSAQVHMYGGESHAPSLPVPQAASTVPFNQSAKISSAEEFASRYVSPVNISIRVPSDSSSTWELKGQTLSVSINVNQTVKELKESIGVLVGGMPSNKQQLKAPNGFLKDKDTLAALNLGDGAVIELSVRSRGGKR